MKKINTILIGLGRIASLLEKDRLRIHPCTHAGVLFSHFGRKRFNLLAAYDIESSKILRFKKDWNLKEIITEKENFSNLKIDLGIIATNSESHFQNLKELAELKIKNILLEKPICLDTNELEEIVKLQKKFQFRLWVNHERRYHPIYNYVKNLIQKESYGKLKLIKASVLTSFRDPGNAFLKAGPLFHDGTHAIDFIDFLIEKNPIRINSILNKKNPQANIEEQVLAFLEYPNQVYVFLEAGGKRNYFQFEIDIQTENARFILSNDGHKFYKSKKSRLYKGFQSLSEFPTPKSIKNPWILLYSEIFDIISGKKIPQKGNLEANLRIFSTLERIQKGS